MDVGSIGYETHSGIGHLMRDFYRNGIVTRVMPVAHTKYATQTGWYDMRDRFTYAQADSFLSGLSALLLFETGFKWDIVAAAKRRGVRIILIPNYEWTLDPLPVTPDLVICGSRLDTDYFAGQYNTVDIPIPVDTNTVVWRMRERARVFVHNAGHGQLHFAKGTPQVLEAMQYVNAPIRLIVRGQPDEPRIAELLASPCDDSRIERVAREVTDRELWEEGDVFINAESYNGMSLMLQEAFAAGMMVMTTDRYPTNTWLPTEPLIAPSTYRRTKMARELDVAVVTPQAIAEKIDAWYDRDISTFSYRGRDWSAAHSWTALKSRYVQAIEKTVRQQPI